MIQSQSEIMLNGSASAICNSMWTLLKRQPPPLVCVCLGGFGGGIEFNPIAYGRQDERQSDEHC